MLSRAEWALVGGLLLLTVAVALFLVPGDGQVALDRRLTTERTTPDGARALYLTLESLGIPVGQRMTPLADGDEVDPALAVLAPSITLTDRELDAVVERVREGGFLLLASPPVYEGGPGDALLEALGYETRVLEGVTPFDSTTRAAAARPHRWSEGIDSLRGVRAYFQGLDSDEGGTEATASPLFVADDSLPVALELRLGEGTVLLLPGPFLLRNERILHSGAATVVARAAREATADGAPLVFDEYHHGFSGGSVVNAVVGFVTGHEVGRTVAALAAVLLLGLLARGVRLGRPDPPSPAGRRSPLEHVDALASVYREAGAGELPRVRLIAGLARRLRRPAPADLDAARGLVASLADRSGPVGDAARALETTLDDPSRSLHRVADEVDHVLHEARR